MRLAVSDAKSFAAALGTAGIGQYTDEKVTEALDRDASARELCSKQSSEWPSRLIRATPLCCLPLPTAPPTSGDIT
jgi:hypothetical protein